MTINIARQLPGLIAGDDVTYLLGMLDRGDEILILDAGGLSGELQVDAVLRLMTALRFTQKHAASLPVEPRPAPSTDPAEQDMLARVEADLHLRNQVPMRLSGGLVLVRAQHLEHRRP